MAKKKYIKNNKNVKMILSGIVEISADKRIKGQVCQTLKKYGIDFEFRDNNVHTNFKFNYTGDYIELNKTLGDLREKYDINYMFTSYNEKQAKKIYKIRIIG